LPLPLPAPGRNAEEYLVELFPFSYVGEVLMWMLGCCSRLSAREEVGTKPDPDPDPEPEPEPE